MPPAPPRSALAVLAAVAMTAAVGACGNGGDGASPRTTVTVTQGTTTPASPTTPATPTATSDVKGRHYDLGTVTGVRTVGGVLVVELDRWTLPGTSDTDVARQGIKVVPHRGARYTNQNTEKTYSAPVADGAIAVVNTCVPGAGGELGLVSTPTSAASWLKKPDSSNVLVVTYDDAGRITRLDTDPRC